MPIKAGIHMPAVSGDYDPDVGILLQVGILTGGAVQATQRAEDVGNDLAVSGAQALGLVDTGASKTSISPRLASSLGLKPSGKTLVQGVTGAMQVNSYAVDLMLGFGAHSAVIENLEVCELDLGQARFNMLIGRDVLCRGVLTMDFARRFTFSI